MTSSLELISTERDLLVQYMDTFNQKQTDVSDKYALVQSRLDDNIKSENDETVALLQLQKQLDELSLTASLDKFKGMSSDLDVKFQGYTTIVQDNNVLATTIFNNLKGTKDLVAEITTVLSQLDASISQINTTIDTYSAASPSMSPAAPETPAVPDAATDVSSQ
jgi:hypothetical protein